MLTKIQITAVSTGKNGQAYVTLYGIDGELIKEAEIKGALSLSYVIPEDGFYYISTMVEKGGELKITLEEKG
jgi:hypothetical protein